MRPRRRKISQVSRAEGAESEMELPFAALHQLRGRCRAGWTGYPARSATRSG
jgi:hypothetical protein